MIPTIKLKVTVVTSPDVLSDMASINRSGVFGRNGAWGRVIAQEYIGCRHGGSSISGTLSHLVPKVPSP